MNYVKLMRIKHYIKNFLVFLPLLFSGGFFNRNNIVTCLLGFICFSLLASTIYIINDIRDRDKDKKHKKKCKRPIASGKISVKNAIIFDIILIIIIVFLCMIGKFNILSICLILFYFIINLIYSFGAKNVPILDIMILVSGFFIRVFFGATILDITVSNWLYLTVIAISFYLGLGKRRNEIIKNGTKSRKVLEYYNKEFLDKNMYMCLTMAVIFYSLWTTDSAVVLKNNNLLIWTVPIVIIIVLRYSLDVEGDSYGDPVDVIMNDKYLVGLGLVYVIGLFVILYLI